MQPTVKGKKWSNHIFRGFYVYRMNRTEFNMEKNPSQCRIQWGKYSSRIWAAWEQGVTVGSYSVNVTDSVGKNSMFSVGHKSVWFRFWNTPDHWSKEQNQCHQKHSQFTLSSIHFGMAQLLNYKGYHAHGE